MIFTMTPYHMTQCLCIKFNLDLPTYEESKRQATTGSYPMEDVETCACGRPLDELLDREIARIAEVHPQEPETTGERGREKERISRG